MRYMEQRIALKSAEAEMTCSNDRRTRASSSRNSSHWSLSCWSIMWIVLAIVILVVIVDLPRVDAKGIQSPPSANEYLPSYFEPSSDESDVEGVVESPVDATTGKQEECVCATPTTKPMMMSHGTESESESEVEDGGRVFSYAEMIALEMENTARLGEMQNKLVTMETRLSDLERSSNKLKKLALASMSVALAEEGESCSEAEDLGVRHLIKGFPAETLAIPSMLGLSDPCENLGTTTKPASSCRHLKLACNKPNGAYYVDSGYFTQVYCEMDLFGGGWARYGRAEMQSEWNFVDEDLIETSFDVIDQRDIKEMIDMKYNTFKIHTDVVFSLQADDSTNPSRVRARILPWFSRAAFYIDGYGENFTKLQLLPGGDRITCRTVEGTSHKCGWGSVPRPNQPSQQLLIESVYFGPRDAANGAVVYMGDWQANRYTWNGSYYYVYAQ